MNQYIGKSLGPYQILEQVGQGGMATVFKAYQPSMDRYVAIKILPAHFTQEENFVARFNQEARTLARLEHPHILPVHDYGEQEGITYLVMRYVEAGTLRDLIAQGGPVGLDRADRIVDQVGRALGYAHSQGVVHRDIKSSNVLIDKRGDAFLTDFGIAKLVSGAARFTATGAVVGTPAYMSPEQGRGEPADARSDIYSLGIVLYEMLTGRVPYEAETPLAVMLKHISEPLLLPSHLDPSLPEAVERVILKALAKSPADRFQTAEEMADALQKAVSGLPTQIILPKRESETFISTQPGGVTPVTTPPLGETATAVPVAPQPGPTAVVSPLPEAATATLPRRPLPWLPLAGGLAVLAVLLIAALLIVPRLGGPGAAGVTPTSAALIGADLTSAAPASSPVELVVDNADPAFTFEGEWGTCVRGECEGYCYGDDFLYAELGCTSCTARFEFKPPEAGEYDVWTWWPQGEDRATDSSFTITHSGDPVVLTVDQRNDGSRWYRLATLAFQAGESVSVVVQGSETGYANADAVAMTRAGDPAPQAPPTPSATAEPEGPPVGWINYTNANIVSTLARGKVRNDPEGNYLWVGGSGGLLRWNLDDGSHVKLDISDGLASNWIEDLLLDEEGNLWLATDAGINRFDGQSWRLFDKTDGLDADSVKTLLMDEYGAVWAGTYGLRGLNYYQEQGKGWGAAPVPPLPNDFSLVAFLEIDQDGGLWVSGGGGLALAYYDGSTWQVFDEYDGLPGSSLRALMISNDGTVWASGGLGVTRRDPVNKQWDYVLPLEDIDVYAMHQASDGSFWFAGDGGAVHYDPTSSDWQPFEPRQGELPERRVTSIIEDELGLWFGTAGGGVVLYDGASWQPWVTEDGPAGNDVFAIQQDGSGALWFAHDDGRGLSRYDPANDTWQTFGKNEGMPIWLGALGVDNEGNLWMSGYQELAWYDGAKWHDVPTELPDDAYMIYEVAFTPDGVQWLKTDAGLVRHDLVSDERLVFTEDDHPFIQKTSAFYLARDGTAWVGANGLAYYGEGEWKTLEAAGHPPVRIHDIAEGADGSLWIAGGDLYHLESGQWRRFDWLEMVTRLAVGPDGVIWSGGGGYLLSFDPASGKRESFTTYDGLVNSKIKAVYVTPEGAVWIGTAGGISRYVPARPR